VGALDQPFHPAMMVKVLGFRPFSMRGLAKAQAE
jgi:hypothetical protein